MKYLVTLCLVVISFWLFPSVTLADGDINVKIEIWGDNPDTWVNIFGANPDVFINGVSLSDIVNNGISAAVSKAVTQSVPNGQYSGALSPGWQGYFGIKNNFDYVIIEHREVGKVVYSVYKGAGCGGAWGTVDGYPDMLSRRQLLGLLPILVGNKYQLEDLRKDVSVLRKTEDDKQTYFNNEIVKLQTSITNLNVLIESKDQESGNAIVLVKNEYDSKIKTIYIIGGIFSGLLLIWCIILTIKLRFGYRAY